jgi:hypothetical protein
LYVERPGKIRKRNLGLMLRQAHERQRAAVLEAIETRRARGAPLKDSPGEPDLEDPGEYTPAPERDALTVKLRVVAPEVFEEYQALLTEAIEDAGGLGEASRDRDRLENNRQFRDAWRHIVREAVIEVDGFEDDDGTYAVTGADLDAIQRAGLLPVLAGVAAEMQRLTEIERGNFGTSQRVRDGAATNAPTYPDACAGATVAPDTDGAPATSTTRAPRGSQSVIPGSGEPSISTMPAAAN